ncbi:hypothetical protein [Amycolatopsis sulphurea]|uniref:hypothetical protein n=1 Tax=Amycolatopsis sulphurea TaxID=76022 RepID=UPI001FEC1540|nr:hypothetical protein [Amycolatopsis sulphurea]
MPAAPAGRVVTTGSFLAKSADLALDDLPFTRGYWPKAAYARSKLAQVLSLSDSTAGCGRQACPR